MLSNITVRSTVLNTLPFEVFNELCEILNVEGPCNWKALVEILQHSQHFFSVNDYQVLCKSSLDSKFILRKILERQVTIDFLLLHLDRLPCQCASTAFSKSLANFFNLNCQHPEYQQKLPVIKVLEQPQDQELQKDIGLLKFRIETNLSDVCYQWYHNNRALSNANEGVLFIEDLSSKSIGHYYCVASSKSLGNRPGGSVRSRTVFVNIHCPISQHVSEYNASDKVALLIGNDQYQHNKQLPAVSRDIRVLTKIFRENLHYKTLSFQNLSFSDMHRVLSLFIDLCLKGCYCVFYFGGHGYENDGVCYLVPTDAPNHYRADDCLQAQLQLEDIQRRCEPSMMLILLDICRKRNPKDTHRNFSSTTRFMDNVVFAYATTENREAFEENGETYGIFVDSLRKHLTKPVRVNHMLSPVQDDVSRSVVQFMEVKSLLSTNRCLTDRLERGEGYAEKYYKWQLIHDIPNLPVLIECVDIGVSFEVCFQSILSNCIQVSSAICKGDWEVSILIDKLKAQGVAVYNGSGFIPDKDIKANSIQISGLQNLQSTVLNISFLLHQCAAGDRVFRKIYNYPLELAFLQAWKLQRKRVFL